MEDPLWRAVAQVHPSRVIGSGNLRLDRGAADKQFGFTR